MNSNNLLALAKFLDELVDPDQFDMSMFREGGESPNEVTKHRCGTVACALGWAPVLFPALPNEDSWSQYSRRVLELGTEEDAWDWCFAGSWEGYDNTPKGAAARIRYLVKNQAPPSDWRQNRRSNRP